MKGEGTAGKEAAECRSRHGMRKYHDIVGRVLGAVCLALLLTVRISVDAAAYADVAASHMESSLRQMERVRKRLQKLSYMPDAVQRTLDMNGKDRQIIDLAPGILAGYKITCLGDSITVGAGGGVDENGRLIGYCNHLSRILGCEVVNLGMGGTTIGDYFIENAFVNRYEQIPEDTDVIILEGGLNDYQVFAQGLWNGFGDITNREPETYCGDAYTLYRGIKDSYPNAEVFVVTASRSYLETLYQSVEPYRLQDFMDVQRLYAKWMGFQVIDLHEMGFLDCREEEARERWLIDIVHPNAEGHLLLAERIASELVYYYSHQ